MEENVKVWKLRTVKDYPEAHNHLMVGEVLEQTPMWISVLGKTYHFGHTVSTLQDIKVGPLMTRIIPWNRIEVIHVQASDFDYANAELVMEDAGRAVTLRDKSHTCRIFTPHHRPY